MLDDVLPSHLRLTGPADHELRPDGLLVLCLSGEVDADSGPPLERAILATAHGRTGIVLDLARVTSISTAGVRSLTSAATRLAEGGRTLLLTGADTLEHPALDRIPRADTGVPQARRHLPPLVTRALDLLGTRYDLPDDVAFGLLRDTCRRHDQKLKTLATALVAAPPPADGEVWFPDRDGDVPPTTTFTKPTPEWRTDRSAFLAAVLYSARFVTAAPMGDVQIIDPCSGDLRLEAHHGLPPEFTSFFAYVDRDSSCAHSLRSGVRAVAAEVRTSPMFRDEATRAMLLTGGVRSVQWTPLLDGGHVLGAVSTMHPEPDQTPSPRECEFLDRIGREAGAWLAWHRRATVLDALEHLHRICRAVPHLASHCG
ncbi:MAG TPA: STAS domain-containing protein [Pseudonocardiaceae bacterium]|nr:STAS domain-containing protein [Pseudonocardiaceae bacterium]